MSGVWERLLLLPGCSCSAGCLFLPDSTELPHPSHLQSIPGQELLSQGPLGSTLAAPTFKQLPSRCARSLLVSLFSDHSWDTKQLLNLCILNTDHWKPSILWGSGRAPARPLPSQMLHYHSFSFPHFHIKHRSSPRLLSPTRLTGSQLTCLLVYCILPPKYPISFPLLLQREFSSLR